MNKDTKYVFGIAVIVLAIGASVTMLFISMIGGLGHRVDDLKDDMEIVPVAKVPYISYSITGYSSELVLGNLTVVLNADYYYVSFVLNEDGEYDMVLDMEGFYMNVSVCIDGLVHGGTIVIDDLHFETVVEEATQDALREAVLESADIEQWTMEA